MSQVIAHFWVSPRGHRVGNCRFGDVGSVASRAREEARMQREGYAVVRAYAQESVAGAADTKDLRRCVLLCHKGKAKKPRWAHVSNMTLHGSTVSASLCRRFGLDPDEIVGGGDPVKWDAKETDRG